MPLPGDCLPPDKLLEMKNKVIKYLNGESAKPSTATVQYLYCVIKNYAVEAGDVRATEPVSGGGMMSSGLSGLATSLGFKSAELTGERIDDDDGTEDVANTDVVNGTDDEGDPLHPKPVLDPKWKSHYEAVFADTQEAATKAKAKYDAAIRETQAARQVAQQTMEREKKADREKMAKLREDEKKAAYEEKTGGRYPCPFMRRGEDCDNRCDPDDNYDHPTICLDPKHQDGNVGNCMLWHNKGRKKPKQRGSAAAAASSSSSSSTLAGNARRGPMGNGNSRSGGAPPRGPNGPNNRGNSTGYRGNNPWPRPNGGPRGGQGRPGGGQNWPRNGQTGKGNQTQLRAQLKAEIKAEMQLAPAPYAARVQFAQPPPPLPLPPPPPPVPAVVTVEMLAEAMKKQTETVNQLVNSVALLMSRPPQV
jgi:hypothetical protein